MSDIIPNSCYICDLPNLQTISSTGSSYFTIRDVHCNRCGTYRITNKFIRSLAALEVEKYLLSAAIRYLSDRGRIPLLDITEENPHGTEKDIVQSFPIPRDPLDMVDLFLEGIALENETVLLRGANYKERISLICGKTTDDVSAIVTLATEMGYITTPGLGSIMIMSDGWKRIRELRNAQPSGNRAFVAMHFTDEMKGIYINVFKPVLVDHGYEVAQTIDPVHNGKIDDFIISEIRKSSLMIADFSQHRPNVYFEAGFAIGLNIEVIKTIKANEIDRHFDTRQYNHIEWKDKEDLRTQLIHRIESLPVRPQNRQ